MSIKANFPSIRPSLNLDFANTKRLDPRITFSRSGSGATYVDANGVIQTAAANVPRFDHDPATGESLGLLIEEQRTNLLTYSEQFDNAAWTKANATITANAAVAPDGTITADKIVEDSTTAIHVVSNTFSAAASTRYSFSVFIKAAERTWAQLFLGSSSYFGGAGVSAYFNLNSGAVGTVTSHATALPSATMKKLQNGWYLCTLTATTNAISGSAFAYIRTANADGGANYLGDGSSGIFVWGAQLEAGASSTSYIPTTSATVTRSADVASIVGANFTNWWNPSSGTFQASFRSTLSGTRPVLSVDDNTANNRIELYTSTSSQKFTVTTGGVAQADITAGTASSTAVNQQSAAYGSNDFSTSLAGAAAVTDTSGTVPVVTQLRIGANQAGDSRTTPIARLAYYPARLTDAQLQTLTR